MAKDNKVQMPTSTAGLTRYFDDYVSKINFEPGHIIIICIAIGVIVILLNIFGKQLLGI